MIQIKEGEFKIFGKCLTISNGSVEAVVTLDVGPRVIRFGKIGGENVMFEDIEDRSNRIKLAPLFAEKFGEEQGVWHIYGGHRLWTSPEKMPRSYFPDNRPLKYETVPGGAKFIPAPQQWDQLQMTITLTMSETEDTVHILHEITNLGAWDVTFAPWALTVLAPGGMEIVPVPQRESGLLANRRVMLWDYTKMSDKRVHWGDKYITLRQDPTAEEAFKLGIDSEHRWAAYFNHGDLFLKRYEGDESWTYPDDGCSFETYTGKDFLEMESLGKLAPVAPGETVSHKEEWKLFSGVPAPSCDEDEITRTMEKYL